MTPNRACQIVLGALDNAINNKFCDPVISDQLKIAADVLIQAMDEIEDIPNMKARIRLLETECAWLESGVWPKTNTDELYANVVQPEPDGVEGKSVVTHANDYLKRRRQ